MIAIAGNQSKKLTWILVGAIVLLLGGLVGVAAIQAANDDGPAPKDGKAKIPPKNSPKGESLIPSPPADQANLGAAPRTEAFGPAYQAQVEKQVRALIDANEKSQGEFKRALEAQQRSFDERMDKAAKSAETRIAQTGAATVPAGMQMANAAPAVPIGPTMVFGVGDPATQNGAPGGQFIGTPGDVNGVAGVSPPGTGAAPTVPGSAASEPSDGFVIPESGFVQGILLNGVVARANAGEFVYTTIKLQGNYTSPNDYQQNVDSCVVVGEARAAFAEGRIRIKPVKLSCTLATGRTRSWKTSGYVVDGADAIEGVVATMVNNQEKRVAVVTAGAILEGIGSVAIAGQSTQAYNPTTGQASSVITGDLGRAAAGGAVRGAGKGLQDEFRQYFDLFQPTVQVGGGTKVTVFLATEAMLPDGGEAISGVRSANPRGQTP